MHVAMAPTSAASKRKMQINFIDDSTRIGAVPARDMTRAGTREERPSPGARRKSGEGRAAKAWHECQPERKANQAALAAGPSLPTKRSHACLSSVRICEILPADTSNFFDAALVVSPLAKNRAIRRWRVGRLRR